MPTLSATELLENAKKRLAEIRTEAHALEKFIASYASIAAADRRKGDSQDDQMSLIQESRRRVHRRHLDEMIAATRLMMISEGRPMKRGEIVQRLLAQGYRIEGSDKNKVFGTTLWRSEKFDAVDGHGYWPKDAPLPAEFK